MPPEPSLYELRANCNACFLFTPWSFGKDFACVLPLQGGDHGQDPRSQGIYEEPGRWPGYGCRGGGRIRSGEVLTDHPHGKIRGSRMISTRSPGREGPTLGWTPPDTATVFFKELIIVAKDGFEEANSRLGGMGCKLDCIARLRKLWRIKSM